MIYIFNRAMIFFVIMIKDNNRGPFFVTINIYYSNSMIQSGGGLQRLAV